MTHTAWAEEPRTHCRAATGSVGFFTDKCSILRTRVTSDSSASMVTSTLDNETRAYFASEADRINFIGQDHRPDSIKQRLLDVSVDVTVTKVLQFRDWAPTVYRFDQSAVDQLALNLTGVADGTATGRDGDPDPSESGAGREESASAPATTASPIYAAEWGISMSSDGPQPSYQYTTLFFDSEPTACDLDQAYEIQLFKSDLRFGQLELSFICRNCDARTHWLSVPSSGPDPTEVPLHVRRELIKDQRCGCTGIADTTADPTTEEAYEL